MIRPAGRFTGPRYSAIPNRHARRGGMASPSPAPRAPIFCHRRMLTGTHEDVTSALVHDGEYCVTASLDGELRVWSEHSGAVRAAFAETTQRVRAHDAGDVTALARVADGYIISGGADGELAVWTRLPDAPPLHPGPTFPAPPILPPRATATTRNKPRRPRRPRRPRARARARGTHRGSRAAASPPRSAERPPRRQAQVGARGGTAAPTRPPSRARFPRASTPPLASSRFSRFTSVPTTTPARCTRTRPST